MRWPLVTLPIAREDDVVAVRQQVRQLAERAGFSTQEQTRLATAVSEIARNAFEYGHGGRATFLLREDDRSGQALVVKIADRGPGIEDPDAVLEGRYRSKTGMGVGLLGARRLVDGFELDTRKGRGTTVGAVVTGVPRPRRGTAR